MADKVGHLPAISEIKDEAGNRHREPPHLPMPAGKVRHMLATSSPMIAAEQRSTRRATPPSASGIDYEELPVVVTAAQALAPGAPLVHDDVPGNLMCRWGKGDGAATEGRVRARRACLDALHPLAAPDRALHGARRGLVDATRPADDIVTVTFSSQGVQVPHRLMCEARARHSEGKAAAGHRGCGRRLRAEISDLCRDRALIAWATRKLGRGLRWTCERAELALADSHARDLVATADLALDTDGHFIGLRVKAQANYGAYVSMFAPTIPTTGTREGHLRPLPDSGDPHRLRLRVQQHRAGRCHPRRRQAEALFLLERLVDLAAHETGRTSVELRRLNLLRADEMPTRRRAVIPTTRPTASGCSGDRTHGRRRAGLCGQTGVEQGFRQAAQGSASPATCMAPAASPTRPVVVNVEADRLIARRSARQSPGQEP